MSKSLQKSSFKISEFLNFLLFDKKFGYYQTRNPIGQRADFITSPEISQLFGEITAIFLLNNLSAINTKFSLVEMGAGRGTWFADILRCINNLAAKGEELAIKFLDLADLHIIEINSILREVQQQVLGSLKLSRGGVSWHENFSQFLEIHSKEADKKRPKPIIFISNELFDCFPIDQFQKIKASNDSDLGWRERLVELEGKIDLENLDETAKSEEIKFIAADFDHKIQDLLKNQIGDELAKQAQIGAIFEYSSQAQAFMNDLCKAIAENGGLALSFDYGYQDYQTLQNHENKWFYSNFANSLQAVKNHQKITILGAKLGDLIGCDLTSHVDFGALAKIAKNHNLHCQALSQREFLLNQGITTRAAFLKAKNPEIAKQIEVGLQRLIGNGENQMGDLFKCQLVWC